MPSLLRLITPATHRRMPWKNGFGNTTEIAIDPPGAAVSGRFRWRLSIAAVERSCPFSAFPGYERTIMLIEGRGMELMEARRPARRLDRLYEPYVFSGDAGVDCRLIGGPIRDFNLMVDRSRLCSRMTVRELDTTPWRLGVAAGERIVHCLAGRIDISVAPTGETIALEPNWTAVFGSAEGKASAFQLATRPDARATVAVIELMPA